MRVRSLFLSDAHLGCRFSRADELFQFLGRVEADRLYLVGDIIDGWKLKRSFYWNDTSSFVVRRIHLPFAELVSEWWTLADVEAAWSAAITSGAIRVGVRPQSPAAYFTSLRSRSAKSATAGVLAPGTLASSS